MTQKEHKEKYGEECQRAMTAGDLEATQIVSWDDLQELEQREFARTAAVVPARQRCAFVLLGSALCLALAATFLLTVILMRSGGH